MLHTFVMPLVMASVYFRPPAPFPSNMNIGSHSSNRNVSKHTYFCSEISLKLKYAPTQDPWENITCSDLEETRDTSALKKTSPTPPPNRIKVLKWRQRWVLAAPWLHLITPSLSQAFVPSLMLLWPEYRKWTHVDVGAVDTGFDLGKKMNHSGL